MISYLCITARQPVGLAVLAQLQAGLNTVLSFALQQLNLVLLQRLRHRLLERRQVTAEVDQRFSAALDFQRFP